ncbi:type VI secretion system protein TssA [Duganella sp. FT3S]|uniref:Type VI secretion system protein TssA n=2 Tax=Rugamonas fusca TaxID=2758568 RepID=A0A7W2I7Q3_9BURK|nr:type VI secretion system protein TssA [Rugamonas fusca]
MGMLNIDALLQDVDPTSPCGPNLEYDPAFLELEQALQGKPEVQYGDTITPAVPPDWKHVQRLASELLDRSRDLRLAVAMLRAQLALQGMAGCADGLCLIECLLVQRWDSVHPQLDPDDDNDPMLRINSLAVLADGATLLRELKEAPLIVLPALGPVSLRTLDIASGEVPPPEGEAKLEMSSIEAALRDADPERVQALSAALTQAHDSAVNIETLLVRQVGSSQALNLDVLVKYLRRARDFANAGMPAEETVAPAADESGGAAAAAPAEGAVRATAAPAAISGEITSRADVVRMLDKIIKYYAQNEPASPVPLLLGRARRLVPKNFFEVLEDLAPDGIAQLLVVSGPRETPES